jgi:hypothetical protein
MDDEDGMDDDDGMDDEVGMHDEVGMDDEIIGEVDIGQAGVYNVSILLVSHSP